jgi:phosphopantothenoylcysteine decarboxylase/phosphopantothenate--cysteine ligase
VPASLELAQNPDILAELSQAGGQRPSLVIGFAAETEKVVEHGRAKRARKGCDWILANDVAPGTATFGGDRNRIHLITADGVDDWPQMTKAEVAERLCRQIAATLGR